MRRAVRLALVGVVATLAGCSLSACGGGETDSGEPASTDSRTESARDESVFDPLTSTIERAESVQDTVDRRAEELRRRIEEQER